jgi:membrane-associated phospholipid phosphatase
VRRYWALLGASVAGFAAVALDVTHHGALERQDIRIDRWAYDAVPHGVVRVADVVTRLGSAWTLGVLAAVAVTFLARRGRGVDALMLAASAGLVSLLTFGLKHAFGRPRPSHESLPLHHTLAFPSGHTSGSTVVLVLGAVLLGGRARRPAVAVAVLLAGLVGVTRVVVHAHWTTDVLAGFCVGGAVVATALLARARLSGVRSARPEAERDGRDGGDDEDERAGRAFAEHRAHDLLPVGDLVEPGRG